jgi:uncharacterized protein
MSDPILIDTSFLYAVYNSADKNHAQAMQFMTSTKEIPLIPEVILPEVTFLFLRDIGHHAVSQFLGKFAETGVQLQSISMVDVKRAQAIMMSYPAARFDFVDSCIMALTERLDVTQVCTFDRRDFTIFRPKHCQYLDLLP